ncbi:unnamed protein product [Ophioblennius macclurei]
MRSSVMKNRQTLNLLPILALASLFIQINGSNTFHVVTMGPIAGYVGSTVVYHCSAPSASLPVTYELVSSSGSVESRYIDNEGTRAVNLAMKVSETSGGWYHCRATAAGGEVGVSSRMKLSIVTPVSRTMLTSEPDPPVVYEGSRLVLSCNVQKGSHLSYSWYFNMEEVTPSALFNVTGNELVVEEVTPEHAGSYSCMAWSVVQNTRRFSSSSDVEVTIKVFLSKPKISFSIFPDGNHYRGIVTCKVSRGSLPVNFTLLLDETEADSAVATESLEAWFLVNVVPGVDMGAARCRVDTERQQLTSDPVTLDVESVDGDASVKVEYLYTSASRLAAAFLTCQVSRGTFPLISWMFNDSAVPVEPHLPPNSVLVNENRTLILTKVGAEESGYYLCRVRDRHDDDDESWLESEAQLVQVTEASMTTTEIISISFCCFLLLMLVVCSACLLQMFDHNQAHHQTAAAATRLDAFSRRENWPT